MPASFTDVYDEKYLLLTTFTKDGRPKPTTVWGVPEGDKLLIITDDGSWKTPWAGCAMQLSAAIWPLSESLSLITIG
jgi:predicted pyridoxine 5'-phosphate oxidase superfamily flavin-nucleotide-binding protein